MWRAPAPHLPPCLPGAPGDTRGRAARRATTMQDLSHLLHYVDRFAGRRLLVAGDVILDHYVAGAVSRISPEAPVPVLLVERDEHLPGGAGNVARNVASLGAEAVLVGVRGDDEAGAQLERLLAATPRVTAALVADGSRPTTLKTRVIAQNQQMIRLDRETTHALDAHAMEAAVAVLDRELARADGVILSDYGKGFLTPALIAHVIRMARDAGKPVFVDPKGRDYARYRGATSLTPNLREAMDATGLRPDHDGALAEAAAQLHALVQPETLFITRGPEGVSVFPRGAEPVHIPARAREVFDVTGAGDTFIAVSALARAAGAPWDDVARIGNAAAGIVVGRAGVATLEPDELRGAMGTVPGATKLRSRAELREIVRKLRGQGRRVVFTNGFFDLLHAGHVRLFARARALGDCLVVALNTDESTRRLAGPPRPILLEGERVDLLSSLPSIDHLVLFGEDTPEALLRELQPDILAKGDASSEVVGREIVEAHGGEVRLIPTEGEASISAVVGRVTGAAG